MELRLPNFPEDEVDLLIMNCARLSQVRGLQPAVLRLESNETIVMLPPGAIVSEWWRMLDQSGHEVRGHAH